MGQGEVNFLRPSVPENLPRSAVETKNGRPALFVIDFYLDEVAARTKTKPQCLSISFLCGESDREVRERIPFFTAILTFRLREHTLLEMRVSLFQDFPHPRNGNDIDAMTEYSHIFPSIPEPRQGLKERGSAASFAHGRERVQGVHFLILPATAAHRNRRLLEQLFYARRRDIRTANFAKGLHH